MVHKYGTGMAILLKASVEKRTNFYNSFIISLSKSFAMPSVCV